MLYTFQPSESGANPESALLVPDRRGEVYCPLRPLLSFCLHEINATEYNLCLFLRGRTQAQEESDVSVLKSGQLIKDKLISL
jgi:hypothetical protein